MKNVAIVAGTCALSFVGLGLGHSLGSSERDAAERLELREASEKIKRLEDQLAGQGATPAPSEGGSEAPADLGGALADAQAKLEAAQAKLASLEAEGREALAKAEAKVEALESQAKERAAAVRQEIEAGQAQALAAKEQALRDAKAESAKLRQEVAELKEEIRKLNDRIGKLEALEKVKLPGW